MNNDAVKTYDLNLVKNTKRNLKFRPEKQDE